MLPRQEDLETAIGQLQRAAKQYGDTPVGLELQEMTIRAKKLREPEVLKRLASKISTNRAAA